MRELRRPGAGQRLENQHMFEGVGEVILAADDVADAQVGVVGAGGHVIGGQAIAAQQREVLDIVRGLGLLAVDAVAELNQAAVASRHAKAQHERFSGRGAPVALCRAELAHPGVEQPPGFVVGFGIQGREIAVGQPILEDAPSRAAMQIEPLGLAVQLVPREIEPLQPLEDGID